MLLVKKKTSIHVTELFQNLNNYWKTKLKLSYKNEACTNPT